MTVNFSLIPHVVLARSPTNKYAFNFGYIEKSHVTVDLAVTYPGPLFRLTDYSQYDIFPVASTQGGTLTIKPTVTNEYNYVIITREYGYGQEHILPSSYSASAVTTTVDSLGMQVQQLNARVKDFEDHGVGVGTPDYLTRFDTDGQMIKEAQISNPSGTVNVHVLMNTGNIASTGNISSSTLNVNGSATAGTMTVSAETSIGSLVVTGTSTLQDTSVRNLTLADYLFTSNYRLFWQLENVEENQIMHFIKGAYTNPEDWAIANVNIDDVLGVRGTPNFLAKFNPTGKNVVDSRVVDPGTGAVTFSAPIETEGATIISSDPVLTYSTGTTATGFSVIPTGSFTKVAIYVETIEPSRVLTVQDTSNGVATLEFVDPPVSDVKPSTADFVAYYDTDTTVSGKPGLIVDIPAATEADYVLKANDDGTASWQESAVATSDVKPSTANFVTYYDTDTTVSGQVGLIPSIPLAGDSGSVLTAQGDGTASWLPSSGGALLKPGDMIATRNKSAITELDGKLYESSSGYEVVPCDGGTLPYDDYKDILEHANMDVVAVPGGLPPIMWWTKGASASNYTACHIICVPYPEDPEFFYVLRVRTPSYPSNATPNQWQLQKYNFNTGAGAGVWSIAGWTVPAADGPNIGSRLGAFHARSDRGYALYRWMGDLVVIDLANAAKWGSHSGEVLNEIKMIHDTALIINADGTRVNIHKKAADGKNWVWRYSIDPSAKTLIYIGKTDTGLMGFDSCSCDATVGQYSDDYYLSGEDDTGRRRVYYVADFDTTIYEERIDFGVFENGPIHKFNDIWTSIEKDSVDLAWRYGVDNGDGTGTVADTPVFGTAPNKMMASHQAGNVVWLLDASGNMYLSLEGMKNNAFIFLGKMDVLNYFGGVTAQLGPTKTEIDFRRCYHSKGVFFHVGGAESAGTTGMGVFYQAFPVPVPVGILAPKLEEHYLVTANKAP